MRKAGFALSHKKAWVAGVTRCRYNGHSVPPPIRCPEEAPEQPCSSDVDSADGGSTQEEEGEHRNSSVAENTTAAIFYGSFPRKF